MILQSPGETFATALRVTAGVPAGGTPRMRPMRCPTPQQYALIPELFVDDAFEWLVTPQVLNIAHETIDIPPSAVLAGSGRVGAHHDIVHIPQRTVGWQGLAWRHVERSTVNLLVLECP